MFTVDYPGEITRLRFSPQGTRLALAQNWATDDDGKVVVVVAVPSGREVARYTDLHGVQALVFRTEEELCVFHGYECWLCHPKRPPRPLVRAEDLEEKSEPVSTGALSPDGKTIAFGASALRLVDVARRRVLAVLPPPIQGYVCTTTFSPDGRLVAAAFKDTDYHYLAVVLVWDVSRGRRVGLLKLDSYGVDALAFHPDHRWLAVVEGQGGTHVRLFDLEDPAVRRADLDELCAGNFSSGRDLLYGVAWTAPVADHDPEAGMIKDLQFSPDGRILKAVGYGGAAVRLYARGGRVLSRVQPPEGTKVGTTAVSSRGLAAGLVGENNSVLLWDVPRWGA
jgi:WD40 repeat protein